MLRIRSILIKNFCLLLLFATTIRSQYYNSDYSATDDVEDDHSSYTEGDDRPDYSKYFNQNTASAPLIISSGDQVKETDSGFVSPLDFNGFFGSPHLGLGSASSPQQVLPTIPITNPFHLAESATNQNSTGFVNPQEYQTGFTASQFNFNPQNFEAQAQKVGQLFNQQSESEDLNANEPAPNGKPKLEYREANPEPEVFQPIGKTSYVSAVKSQSPQYFPIPKYTNAPTNTKPVITPYKKYSFQHPTANNPVKDSEEYAEQTEQLQKVQGANCLRIAKQITPEDISHGRFRREADAMDCFVCKDPKTGGTFEKCSYTSDPDNDKSYFHGHAQKYKTKLYSSPEYEEETTRRRRSARDRRQRKQKEEVEDEEEAEEYVNPFDDNKKSSHQFSSKPEQFDSDRYYKAPDFSSYEKDANANYRFGPEYFGDSTNEKSYSEIQSEKLKKSGDNCKKIKKGTVTCMVCSNPKTGGNYEQCSYTSEPQEKKYAYVKEKTYNSNDPEGEEKSVESTESKPVNVQRQRSRSLQKLKEKPAEIKTEYYPHHVADATHSQRVFNRNAEDRSSVQDKQSAEDDREDYVHKLFPQYAEKESQNKETHRRPGFQYQSDLPAYFTAEESKRDVDTVLKEFTKKDRSNCKKIAKDKMTCYLCVDSKGVQHEECMFVSESQPKSSHIAYHEVKEFKSDPQRKQEETSDTIQPTEKVPIPIKRKAPLKKVVSLPAQIRDVDSEPTEVVKLQGKTPRIIRRKTNISKDLLGSQAQPSEKFEVRMKNGKGEKIRQVKDTETDDGGAFASELVPQFSKKIGMSLPAYMLQISEGEKQFDEAVRAGR